MRSPYGVLLGLTLILASPGIAFAERDATPAETRRVTQALVGMGYTAISDVDVVGNRFVVDARSPRGRDVDVHLDRRTLRVLREVRS